MNAREATIALNMLPKIGPVRVRRLIEQLGSPEAILTASTSSLTSVQGIGNETAKIIHDWENHIDLTRELSEIQQRGISVVTLDDSNYPEPLRQMYDPPLALYVWGELLPQDNHAIAMVGSRKTTYYGRETAKKLSYQLAANGLTIISGMARGIDTHSHEGALAAKGRTIAVIGSGLGQVYPPENMPLAEKIADGNGAVVSEFPLHQPPDKKTFPQRNRVVAAWSKGVLVVECPAYSGSMITANLASDMGKTIYAVPGQIDRPSSAGCHHLIRDGATLITDGSDILDDLSMLPLQDVPHTLDLPQQQLPNLSNDEKAIYTSLEERELLLDEIIKTTGLSTPAAMTTLLQLEMKKLITQLPGPRYVRKS